MSVGDATSHDPGRSQEERDGVGRDPEYCAIMRGRSSYSRDGCATLASWSECPSKHEGREDEIQDEKADEVVVLGMPVAAVAIDRVDEEGLQQQRTLTTNPASASPRRTSSSQHVSASEAEEVSLRQATLCRHRVFQLTARTITLILCRWGWVFADRSKCRSLRAGASPKDS